jgi:predicted nucleic acid-binding protein
MPVLLLISDANILIDLECAGLSEAMFSLGYRFGVPDVLFAEELEERHAHLLGFGLEALPLSPAVLADMERLAARYRKPSRNDLFALALARAERCPLLTGDGDLRAAAKTEEMEVRGTIWLIEEMVLHHVLSTAKARAAYDLMREQGRRLPWKDAFDRLDALGSVGTD